MVVLQAVDMMLEGIEPCSSENAGLPHAPSEQLAYGKGLGNELLVSAEHASHRAAQTLGKAEGDGVGILGIGLDRNTGGCLCIEDPRSIHMNLQVVGGCKVLDHLKVLKRVAVSSDSILHLDEGRSSHIVGTLLDQGLEIGCVEHSPRCMNGDRQGSGYGCNGADLMLDDMAVGCTQDFLGPSCLDVQADKIAHAPRRDKESSFFSGKLGCQFFEFGRCGVFPIDIIPDFSCGHCFPHFQGGFCNRITSEVKYLHARSSCFCKTIPNTALSVQLKRKQAPQ
ncbi:hypothetical protein DSECCO2_656550 [anaerobic digester metagenome]